VSGSDPPLYLTDLGNSDRLDDFWKEHVRWVKETNQYVVWNGLRWKLDNEAATHLAKVCARAFWKAVQDATDPADRDKLYRHAKASEKLSAIEAAMKLARSKASVCRSVNDFDADSWLAGCGNGVIDLRTGDLLPAAPGQHITKCVNARYVRGAAAPLWSQFLERIMAGDAEMIGYLQRVAGLCLTGDISVQELIIFHGAGANGKSVFLDTLLGLYGDYATVAAESLLTMRAHAEHPTEIADLQGRRMVVGSESEEGAALRVQLVKRLTGDETLKGRGMRENYRTFRRTHKTILCTNNRPLIRETSNAVWRRIRLIPFSVVIPPEEQDPHLADKLRKEWVGILAWAVRGCLDWQRDGMNPPSTVLLATSTYQSEQDPIGEYVADRCVRGGENVKVGRNNLYSDYQSWCVQIGEKQPMPRNAFYDRIRRVAGVVEGTWKPAGSTSPVRGFRGIGLSASHTDDGVNGAAEEPQATAGSRW
jgi:putative DNA primase/helicase